MTSKTQAKILFPTISEEIFRSDFEFQKKIGDGAFGQVWRVKNKKTSKIYAIKQVPKSRVIRMLDQFRRELSIMYSIDHPYIVKLHNHFEDEKFFYMLMELIEGGNLFNKLSRENTFLERAAAQYFRELVLAIEYLHTRNPPIIHRDIKPENILIDKSGKVKLTDFGWANYVSKSSERLTSCGTLEYLPPEMVGEKGHDTCADIWCLGILLYEMLAGTTPFKANGKEKIMKNIINGNLNFPLTFSHIAKDLVLGLLEKDRSKRLNIFQVKSHRWLSIVAPIRETIVQDFSKNLINEKTDEVKTAYSENDTDEEIKMLSENAFRKSINALKGTLRESTKEYVSNRSSLKENCKEFFDLCLKEKDLEEKIREKNKEIIRVVGNNKELLSKCFDANLDLERLQNLDSLTLVEKKGETQKKLGDLKKMVKLHQFQLENTKIQIKNDSNSLADAEKRLKFMQKQLQDLKDSSSYSKQKEKSGINELSLSVDVIKSRISEKEIISHFSQSDKVTAKEISEFIRENMTNRKDFMRELNRKLEEIEENANDKEQQISELSIEYEMKKSQKMHFLRKKKDEFVRGQRRIREENRISIGKNNEDLRIDLKFKLSQARKNEVYVESKQLDDCRNRIQNLKNMMQRLGKIKLRKQSQRTENLNTVKSNEKNIQELELEIGELKSKVLTMDLDENETFD